MCLLALTKQVAQAVETKILDLLTGEATEASTRALSTPALPSLVRPDRPPCGSSSCFLRRDSLRRRSVCCDDTPAGDDEGYVPEAL